MSARPVHFLVLAGLLMGASGAAEAQTKKKRYYIKIYSVAEPKGTKPSLKPRATALLKKLLAKQPEVITSLGPKVMTRAQLAKYLAANKLVGFELGLRITKADHAMHPPKPGKVYKVLMVDVAVAINTQKIPKNQLALAGEGSASVGVEASRLKEKERVELLHEGLGVALTQAMTRTMFRIKNPVVTQKPFPRKRKRKGRRRRGKGRKKR